ncbi:MAG: cation transporter, partial [Solobacterium sp.]|nr:cation transporter [Solobacterium sp.]
MAEKATYKFDIKGIDCANCAAKLETKIKEIAGISNVVLNYMNETLVYDCDQDRAKEMEEAVRAVAAKEEPESVITAKGHSHHRHEHHHDHEEHDHCDCHCEEHEEETATYKFDIKGLDCANCAAKLEAKIKEIAGISNVVLNYMNETLVYDCDHDRAKELEEAVRALAAKEEPEAVITAKGHSHHHHEHHHDHEEHDHCDCHCEEHEEETAT